MICPNCFARVFKRDVFCPNCGYQIYGKKSSNDSPGYRLNAKLPTRSDWQSLMSARYIARYKRAMGFPFNKKNIVHAENNSDLNYERLPKPLKTVYQREQDTKVRDQKQFILSFEDAGLLIMGVAEFVREAIYKDNGPYDFNDYNFHFTHQNRFIPKSKIDQVDLKGDPSNRKLVVNLNQRQVRFQIPKVWEAKRFQTKNFQRLDHLVKKLN